MKNLKLFLAFILLALVSSFSEATSYRGKTCRKGETNPDMCMVCAIYFEDNTAYIGMLNVGRTIMERVKRSGFPKSICGVVYQPGQFVAVARPRTLPNVAAVDQALKAAKEAQRLGGNGYLGFRSYCRPGAGDVRIGGNCYRKRADIEDGLTEELIQVAELIQAPTNPVRATPAGRR